MTCSTLHQILLHWQSFGCNLVSFAANCQLWQMRMLLGQRGGVLRTVLCDFEAVFFSSLAADDAPLSATDLSTIYVASHKFLWHVCHWAVSNHSLRSQPGWRYPAGQRPLKPPGGAWQKYCSASEQHLFWETEAVFRHTWVWCTDLYVWTVWDHCWLTFWLIILACMYLTIPPPPGALWVAGQGDHNSMCSEKFFRKETIFFLIFCFLNNLEWLGVSGFCMYLTCLQRLSAMPPGWFFF